MLLFGIGSKVVIDSDDELKSEGGGVQVSCVAIRRDHVVLSNGDKVDFKTIEACF